MTKLQINGYPEIIPGLDPVEMKRKVQAEIRRETEGMTGEQVREFFRKESETFQAETRLRRASKTGGIPDVTG